MDADRPRFEIDEREPCEQWEELDDTGYCKNCGGQQIVHRPWIDAVFDWMEAAGGR